MSRPTDPPVAAEADSLDDLKDRIETQLDRMKPSRVKLETIRMMDKQMAEVQELTMKYNLGVKSFLRQNSSVEEGFKEELKTNLSKINDDVEAWENNVCAAIHRITNPQPNVAQPSAVVTQVANPMQHQQDLIAPGPSAANTIIAKAEVKYQALLNLALSTSQDMDDYGHNLESVIDEKISKLVQKIPKFEKVRDKLESSHVDYLEFTAVHKPDASNHDPANLSQAVNDAIADINNLISDLEDQDAERGLATLLPRKMEKIKWPRFSGNQGENFFKFKESFFKATK